VISCGANGDYDEIQWSYRRDVEYVDANKGAVNYTISITIKALL
jgi:uncharacterized Tic20 family protein